MGHGLFHLNVQMRPNPPLSIKFNRFISGWELEIFFKIGSIGMEIYVIIKSGLIRN